MGPATAGPTEVGLVTGHELVDVSAGAHTEMLDEIEAHGGTGAIRGGCLHVGYLVRHEVVGVAALAKPESEVTAEGRLRGVIRRDREPCFLGRGEPELISVLADREVKDLIAGT